MLKIYGDTEDNTTYLKLVKDGKFINLIATDSKGKKLSAGILLTIGPDGVISRVSCVNPAIGIKLNNHGEIALYTEVIEERLKEGGVKSENIS